MPNVAQEVEQLDLSHTACANVKDSLGLAVSSKAKHATPIQPSSHTPKHLSQRSENVCLHKNLHVNVHSSFICNCQKI